MERDFQAEGRDLTQRIANIQERIRLEPENEATLLVQLHALQRQRYEVLRLERQQMDRCNRNLAAALEMFKGREQ